MIKTQILSFTNQFVEAGSEGGRETTCHNILFSSSNRHDKLMWIQHFLPLIKLFKVRSFICPGFCKITIMRLNKKIGSFSIRKQFCKSSNFNANSFEITFFIKICKDQYLRCRDFFSDHFF